MGSRREEERNEKIIRGLMKLPPNRRCINCNSMGPQYVCTNFWTFVCMTCSGIHREFTHRVKSVSMSKFTSQEVDALQAGGNQRAKETYLKSWDIQSKRLPDNSNVEKVREFIKSVYVDKKYTGGNTSSKPPRDFQSVQNLDNDTRRASSYHSYSQSPPYDFQYEDRINRKQNGTLTRKPGSDRGTYAGKLSTFISSPSRFNEDGFANENSGVRLSDYSVSSGGDPTRSGAESPGIQKDSESLSSPVQHPKRTVSCGSILASFVTNNVNNEIVPDSHIREDNNAAPPLAAFQSMDLFESSAFTASDTQFSSPIDLFQLPGAPTLAIERAVLSAQQSSQDLISPSLSLPNSCISLTSGSVDHHSDSMSDKNVTVSSTLLNDGWANFDSFQPSTSLNEPYFPTAPLTSGFSATDLFDGIPSIESSLPWNSSSPALSPPSDTWKESLEKPLNLGSASTHVWDAFDDSSFMQISKETAKPVMESKSVVYDSLLAPKQNPLDLFPSATAEKVQQVPFGDFSIHPSIADSSFTPALGEPATESRKFDANSHKSTNPFDVPFDSDIESSNMFLDMTTLQAALPDSQLSTSFLDVVNQQWIPQDPAPVYTPTMPQGGATFMTVQTSKDQLGNIKPEGPVVSIGGNPFA